MCAVGGRAFSSYDVLGRFSWAAGPGSYDIVPLALGNGGGLERPPLDGYSPDIA